MVIVPLHPRARGGFVFLNTVAVFAGSLLETEADSIDCFIFQQVNAGAWIAPLKEVSGLGFLGELPQLVWFSSNASFYEAFFYPYAINCAGPRSVALYLVQRRN